MKSLGRSIGVLIIAGAATAGGFLGFNLLENARFAFAEQKVETTREGLSQIQSLSNVFRYVGKTVEPSVVNINVKKTIHNARQMPPEERFFRRFFPDQDGDGQPDMPDMPGAGPGHHVTRVFQRAAAVPAVPRPRHAHRAPLREVPRGRASRGNEQAQSTHSTRRG